MYKSNFNTNEVKNNLVKIFDNELRISHRIIAKETDVNEVSVRKLIDKHKAKFERFGQLSFEMTTVKNSVGAENDEKTYFLNEAQSTLLLTFMRNNEVVIDFKVRLVEIFYAMKKEISQKPKINLTELLEDSKKALELIHLFENENPVNLIKLDRFMKKNEKVSPLELLEMDFKNSYFLPTELGNIIGKSPVEINLILEKNGFQFRENGVWKTTEKGHEFSISFQNGSYFQIKWKLEVLGLTK